MVPLVKISLWDYKSIAKQLVFLKATSRSQNRHVTLSMAKNGKNDHFHGNSLNSLKIPFGNVINGSVKLRGYKSTN